MCADGRTRQQRREEIIHAGVGYFAEIGFGSSVRVLEQRAGVSQSLLDKHFASKAEPRAAVVERVYLGRITPQLRANLRDRDVRLGQRLCDLHGEYTRATFTHE